MTDITPTSITPVTINSDGLWEPIVGPATTEFLDRKVPDESQEAIGASAAAILSKSVDPSGNGDIETGLVVGYVQSGKTMSFEAVTAMARDNGYQIVIVLAGVSKNLLKQSTDRLADDLGINDVQQQRRWVLLANPDNQDVHVQSISGPLDEWRDPHTPDNSKRTVLITVLKHYQRISKLTELLSRIDLSQVPVLVVDDEADQASLNNETSQGEESTTYSMIMELRRVLPKHTYLQYTATPQAPLLINIIDALSPNFVEVLEPGSAYVGGRAFFVEDNNLVRNIPYDQVPTRDNPLLSPPDTLIDALRVFMLGIAAAFELGQAMGNRSMLVHPSYLTAQHNDFCTWIRDLLSEWQIRYGLDDTDPDKQEWIEGLREAYVDLSQTVGSDIPEFETLLNGMRHAIRNVQVLEVNAAANGKTPEVNWRQQFGWILVGGAAMDRGFTVEGLTVTYMPRGVGVGNADTVQQRARFFGYKRSYIGYCRVYLENSTIEAFEDYVEHEEDIRTQLKEIQSSGGNLNDWKRAFVLSRNLQPCRNSVLDFDYMRVAFGGLWVHAKYVAPNTQIVTHNRNVTQTFIANHEFEPDQGHKDRTQPQRHLVSESIRLEDILNELLIPYRTTAQRDSLLNTTLLLQLGKILEANPDEVCSVYQMSSGGLRSRLVRESGELGNIFQGEYPVTPKALRGSVYPGDRKVKHTSNITIQIYRLTLTETDNSILADDVYVPAVYIPSSKAATYVVQSAQ